MTEEIFREDAYARDCQATVTAINERGGIVLDRTVFYPTGGGQPGDRGVLETDDGREIAIATTVYGDDRSIVHVPTEGQELPAPGSTVTARRAARPRPPRIALSAFRASASVPSVARVRSSLPASRSVASAHSPRRTEASAASSICASSPM